MRINTLLHLAIFFIFTVPHAGFSMQEDQWSGLSYDDLGISQEEFQKVRESGMSKSRLFMLLEHGITPNEYFSEPWKRLGVSKSHWLNEKKVGMADDDIDRSYRKQSPSNFTPFITLMLPGYYQYRTDRFWYGFTLSAIAATAATLTIFHRNSVTGHIHPYYPIIMVGSMFWSAADAFLDTRYVDNQEASRFSGTYHPPSTSSTAPGLLAFDF